MGSLADRKVLEDFEIVWVHPEDQVVLGSFSTPLLMNATRWFGIQGNDKTCRQLPSGVT